MKLKLITSAETIMLSGRIAQALVALFMLFYTEVLAQMCSSRENFKHVREDTAITGSTFHTLTNVGLVGCSRQCLLRSACQSFNYDPRTQECQLNKNRRSTIESGNVKHVVGCSSSENWPSKIAGACRTRSCPDNSVCVEKNENAFCKIECPKPTLQNGSFTSPFSHDVGDELTFDCNDGFRATGIAKCQADGTWSLFKCFQGCVNPPNVLNAELISPGDECPVGITLEYECKGSLEKVGDVSCLSDGTWTEMKYVARHCSSVLQCNKTSLDGEYWLYPKMLHDKPVKIFCHHMTTGNPLEYLTLPEENYADYSDVSCDPRGYLSNCEPIRFYKVRITDISRLLIGRDGLHHVSFTNYSAECDKSHFASAFDCHASCNEEKTTNIFINTNGTGLKVHPN